MILYTVIRWQNGMVMVFDNKGKQMPDFQGPIEEVRDRILRHATAETLFTAGNWLTGTMDLIRREEF